MDIFRKPYASAVRYDDVLDCPYSGNTLHPTQKPVEALLPVIQSFSRPNDIVLDPFCGSGSTLVAARRSGRRFIGCELDAQYANAAASRLCAQPRC
jgi:site-specific DNA-methyltransferase (adenine-specific)